VNTSPSPSPSRCPEIDTLLAEIVALAKEVTYWQKRALDAEAALKDCYKRVTALEQA